jgi:hypothetical protein
MGEVQASARQPSQLDIARDHDFFSCGGQAGQAEQI